MRMHIHIEQDIMALVTSAMDFTRVDIAEIIHN
jgi:hypothetical protein